MRIILDVKSSCIEQFKIVLQLLDSDFFNDTH
jgi:hypothetical protein